MSHYECPIDRCGFDTHSPLGMTAHARKHRNEFERLVGRRPEEYAEVRKLFNTDWVPEAIETDGNLVDPGRPSTLLEFAGGEQR